MSTHHKGKISYTLQAINVLPLLLLGIVILLFGSHRFTQTMYSEVEVELKCVAANTVTLLNVAYPGDYKLVGDTSYQLYKGEQDITRNYTLIDQVKEDTSLEITLFYQDTRILTTIRDYSGSRIVGTGAHDTIIADVLSTGEPHFYNNAVVNGSMYFSYYMPLFNSDGSVTGMLFVGKPRNQVDEAVQHSLYPLVIADILAIIVMSVCISCYTKGIVSILLKIRNFLSSVAAGDLNAELDSKVLKRNDEFGEIGYSILVMQRSLRSIVEKDPLTNLFNRRCADRKLRQIMEKSSRENTPFALSIGDIDFFKKVNDTYGHECGDIVLQEVAEILRKHMHSCGFAARWGGEEFLLVFDRMDLDTARESLEKLLEEIRSMEVPYNGHIITLTMTFGITAGADADIKELLHRADEKLYEGKTSGRNCIVS